MSTITIVGWREGLKKIDLTKIIRKYKQCGLAESKSYTDKILDGEIIVFANLEPGEAKEFLREIQDVGAIATIG